MQTLAALMVSITLLTTVLLMHAIATADDRDAPRTGPLAIRDPRGAAGGRAGALTMEYRFEFAGSPQDVTVIASGAASVSGFGRLFENLCGQLRFEPGMLILLDLVKTDMSAIPLSEAPEIGRGLAEFRDRCEGCAMAVVCDPLTAVLMREGVGGAQTGSTSGWLVSDEASVWLESQRALRTGTPTQPSRDP